MKIAVLSDIHGNYVALQACIDYALDREIDTFVFLGDYVGELAYPQKTMDILFSLREKYYYILQSVPKGFGVFQVSSNNG